MKTLVTKTGFGLDKISFITLIFTITICSLNAMAASFDCKKALSEIEKKICADSGLSYLDDSLGKIYRQALKTVADVNALKKDQMEWLKERNECPDKDCIDAQYIHRISELRNYIAAQPTTKVPRFAVVQGKGWTVCETYTKFLNSLPESEPIPYCDLILSTDFPDLQKPNWEILDIKNNIKLLYEFEKLTSLVLHNRTVDNFESWKAVFENDIKTGKASPELKQFKIILVSNGPVETIISYIADKEKCSKSNALYGYSFAGNSPKLFFSIKNYHQIDADKSQRTFGLAGGDLILFRKTPLTYSINTGAVSPNGEIAGRIHFRHFLKPFDLDGYYPNPERCVIGFVLPLETIHLIMKPVDKEAMGRIFE